MFKKIIIILIILVVLMLLCLGIIFLLKPNKSLAPSKPEAEVTSFQPKLAILSLDSPKVNYQLGETLSLIINLDSKGLMVDGVDVLITYNPSYLKPQFLTDKNPLDTTESVFTVFPLVKIDEAMGQIKFSALSSPGQSFTGKGQVAKLQFKTIHQGETFLEIKFKPGLTNDSNVALTGKGKDILGKVEGLKIFIQ